MQFKKQKKEQKNLARLGEAKRGKRVCVSRLPTYGQECSQVSCFFTPFASFFLSFPMEKKTFVPFVHSIQLI